MADKKSDILNAVANRLQAIVDDGTLPDVLIQKNLFREIDPENLPIINIDFDRGSADRFDNEVTYRRKDSLNIIYTDNGNHEDLTDKMYDAEGIISDFLINDHNRVDEPGSIYHQIDDIEYQGWEVNYEKANVPVAMVMMKFQISYSSTHTLTYDDFDTAVTVINPSDSLPDTETIASDIIDLSNL